jgi:hypothetical protein
LVKAVGMRTIRLFLLLLAGFSGFGSLAQTTKIPYSHHNYLDVAIGANKNQFGTAFSWYKLHGIGKRKSFKAGYGLRFSTFSGKDQNYVTAPARLTSGKTGPFVILTENILENFDTLHLTKAQVYYLNASINLQYDWRRFGLGFNIDVIGFSFGKQKTARFTANSVSEDYAVNQPAKPTSFNLLLSSDNDIGSLNSEFYIAYRIHKRIALRGAYSFSFSEYTTDNKLAFNNDRFRNKVSMYVVAVSYNPFLK